MRFYRDFHDWELEAVFFFLDFFHSRIPRGVGSDRLHWCLKGSGKFDTWFFYQEIWDTSISIFPWKGIWKGKVPKSVPLFMWTTALCRILTLDGLMRRGLPLVKRWCMFRCNG